MLNCNSVVTSPTNQFYSNGLKTRSQEDSVDPGLHWPHPEQRGGTCLSGARLARVCQFDQEVDNMK